jgi:tetratricopeptide (TPR) repeat protein
MLAERPRWLPLDRVLFESSAIEHPESRARFYAQSWLLTHYLFDDPARAAQLGRYMARLIRGEEPRAAFAAAFERTPAEMQRDVTAYAFGRLAFRRMDRASIARSPTVAVTRLPASAGDLLLAEGALRLGRADADLLARIRRAAARHQDDYARRVLAHAEILHGDPDAGDRLLEPLLAASPNDAELLYLRGMRHLVVGQRDDAARRERFRQARPWFVRAHRADPNHFQTLYRYAETFIVEENFTSENNAEILLLAHSLAPQVAQIRMAGATMLLARGEFDLAETLARPLASTAHQGSLAVAARELIAKAQARDSSGVGFRFEAPEAFPAQ